MQAETILALAKHLASEKSALPVGRYEVNEEVRLKITGTVARSGDVEYTPTTSVPWKMVAALLLEKMGVTRDAATAMLEDACREAIETDRLLSSGQAEIKEQLETKFKHLDVAEKRVAKLVSALPKKTRSGPTTITVNVEELPLVVEQAPVSTLSFPSIAG